MCASPQLVGKGNMGLSMVAGWECTLSTDVKCTLCRGLRVFTVLSDQCFISGLCHFME